MDNYRLRSHIGGKVAMTSATLTTADLSQFTGSENWYRHSLNRDILYTEGAQYVAEAGGAYWLLDEIALANRYERRVKAEEFQVWTLTRDKTDNGATLDLRRRQREHGLLQADPVHRFPARYRKAILRGRNDPITV